MNGSRRIGIVAAVSASVALFVSISASANPTREVFDAGGTTVVDTCGFPIQWQSEGKFAVISFTDELGNVFKTIEPIAGRLQFTATNLVSGEALTFHISGPGVFQTYPDGSFSFTTFGPWLVIRNPITLEFGMFLIQGRRERAQDAAGNVVFTFHGHITDVCALFR
jgi:hypothetical protein